MTFRSTLYFIARLLGDANAIKRGLHAVVKRLTRKALLKRAGRLVR